MSDTTDKDTITITNEELKSITTALDELKSLKEELHLLKESKTKEEPVVTKEPTKPSVRDGLIAQEEEEQKIRDLELKMQQESTMRDYWLTKAKALGGRAVKIAENYERDFYSKGYATSKVNDEFLKELITEIATNNELNSYIPTYKENDVKEFLAMPEATIEQQDKKLNKARLLSDVMNTTLEIKARSEEQQQRLKANSTFNGDYNGDTDPISAKYYERKAEFKEQLKNGRGFVWE